MEKENMEICNSKWLIMNLPKVTKNFIKKLYIILYISIICSYDNFALTCSI